MRYVKLAGRCANGWEGGRGRRVHAVEGDTPFGRALCGAKPGRLSAGWGAHEENAATCPRCLSRAAHDEPGAPEGTGDWRFGPCERCGATDVAWPQSDTTPIKCIPCQHYERGLADGRASTTTPVPDVQCECEIGWRCLLHRKHPAPERYSGVVRECGCTATQCALHAPIEQVDAMLRAEGGDPEAIGRRGAAFVASLVQAPLCRVEGCGAIATTHLCVDHIAPIDDAARREDHLLDALGRMQAAPDAQHSIGYPETVEDIYGGDAALNTARHKGRIDGWRAGSAQTAKILGAQYRRALDAAVARERERVTAIFVEELQKLHDTIRPQRREGGVVKPENDAILASVPAAEAQHHDAPTCGMRDERWWLLQNKIWDAINRYAVSCGGDPSDHVYGNTLRQTAVAEVSAVLREFVLPPDTTTPAPDVQAQDDDHTTLPNCRCNDCWQAQIDAAVAREREEHLLRLARAAKAYREAVVDPLIDPLPVIDEVNRALDAFDWSDE